MRLPRRVKLSKTCTVKVCLVSARDLAEELDEDNVPAAEQAIGGWVHEDMTIYVLKTLAAETRWWTFCHELAHAAIDLAGENGKAALL